MENQNLKTEESEDFELARIKEKLSSLVAELVEVRKIDGYEKSAKYEKLKVRIPEFIWRYAQKVFPNGIFHTEKQIKCNLSDATVEITEFAVEFVKKFTPDSEKDIFGYLYSVLRQKILTAGSEKDKLENRHGVRLSENKTDESVDSRYAELVKICQKEGKNIHDEGIIKWLSAQTGKSEESIKYLVESHSFYVTRETRVKNDGEEISIFDSVIARDIYKKWEPEQIENIKKILGEKLKSYLEEIQKTYDSTNAQPKKDGYLSSLLTMKVLQKIERNARDKKIEFSKLEFSELIPKMPFIDDALLEEWKNGRPLKTQEEISKDKNRNPTKASQVLNKFQNFFE